MWRSIERLWKSRIRATLGLLILTTIVYFLLHNRSKTVVSPLRRAEFSINTQWDGQPIDHDEILLSFAAAENGLKMTVEAPFFNDPPSPGTQPGEALYGLWNYEVVEAFFLNDNKQYLEVEVCPHGQHLVLMLSDYRKVFNQLLPLKYVAEIKGKTWKGEAIIPWDYFPPGVKRLNAYAIHGTATRRVYEALYPVPQGTFSEPDFHRLEYFRDMNFDALWPKTEYGKRVEINSPFWK